MMKPFNHRNGSIALATIYQHVCQGRRRGEEKDFKQKGNISCERREKFRNFSLLVVPDKCWRQISKGYLILAFNQLEKAIKRVVKQDVF